MGGLSLSWHSTCCLYPGQIGRGLQGLSVTDYGWTRLGRNAGATSYSPLFPLWGIKAEISQQHTARDRDQICGRGPGEGSQVLLAQERMCRAPAQSELPRPDLLPGFHSLGLCLPAPSVPVSVCASGEWPGLSLLTEPPRTRTHAYIHVPV